jgi:hypothetical protein
VKIFNVQINLSIKDYTAIAAIFMEICLINLVDDLKIHPKPPHLKVCAHIYWHGILVDIKNRALLNFWSFSYISTLHLSHQQVILYQLKLN